MIITHFTPIFRISPERLFLQYILDKSDQIRADRVAIVCRLDINNLYQLAANLKLEQGDVQQAARFFQQSKVNATLSDFSVDRVICE